MRITTRLTKSVFFANRDRKFHLVSLVYVFVLCFAVILGSDPIKFAANSLAIYIFISTAVSWWTLPRPNMASHAVVVSLVFFYIGMTGSIIFSYSQSNFVDIAKIAFAPSFLFFGAAFAKHKSNWNFEKSGARIAFGLLIAAPLLAWGLQGLVGVTDTIHGAEIGIFANRNNAGLYAITLTAFYSVLNNRPINNFLIYVLCGLIFWTLGLLFAIAIALILSINTGKKSISLIFLLLACYSIFSIYPTIFGYTRIQPVIDSVVLLFSGKENLEYATYADIVKQLNTSDLSFLFRIKHWLNLYRIYINGTLCEWLFGFGAGSSVRLSDMRLVPHNDYIRLLFEFGIITFLGFISLLYVMVRTIGRGWVLIPYMTVIVYFFSENLINNYIAMVFFFFSAGAVMTKMRFANRQKRILFIRGNT